MVEEVEASYRKVFFYPTNFETGIIYREEIFFCVSLSKNFFIDLVNILNLQDR